MPKRPAAPLPACTCGFQPTAPREPHVHAVVLPDGRCVVGQPAIGDAIREWSRTPRIARAFARLLAAAEARDQAAERRESA